MKKVKVVKIEAIDENLAEKGDLIAENKPKNYRHWLILLYEDTMSYNFNEVLQVVKSQKNYAYIKHFPESNEKKEHYHVILSFENARSKKSLSNKLGVPENYIDEIKSFRTICRYLIHKDDDDKFQYSLDQVKISKCFERQYKKQFDDLESEEDIINNIYIFISSLSSLSYTEALRVLIQYINSHVYDTIYKRYRFEFQDYLKTTCNLH